MAGGGATLSLVIGVWLAIVVGSWASHRHARRRQAWLRSDVPTHEAYARLRAEIDRSMADAPADVTTSASPAPH
jgi:hypothetical protein